MGDEGVTADEVFDARTSNAFSIGGTVLPVTFGLLRLSAVTIPIITIVLLAAALVVYVALLFLCVAGKSLAGIAVSAEHAHIGGEQ